METGNRFRFPPQDYLETGIRFLVTPKRISVSTEANFCFGVSGKRNFVFTGNKIPFLDFIFDVVQPCPLVGSWLLQHATTIGDSQLCFLRFDSNEVNHAPVGWRHSLSPGSPPDSTVEYKQGMAFYS